MGLVYLIHFDRPLGHAKHYLGYTSGSTVWPRLAKHRNGSGSKLLAELNRLGIGYRVVRIWTDSSRGFERKLKNRKEAHVFCPYCQPEKNRKFLYHMHHENQDNLSPEEERFTKSLGSGIKKRPNRDCNSVERVIAARLHRRGLISKTYKGRFVYWSPLEK